MIKAIILDWSGVISDDLELVHGISNKIFKKLGKPAIPIDEFRDKFDLPYMDFYRASGITLPKSKLDGMYKRLYLKSGMKAKPFPFAKKALLWLKKKGMKLAVFSSHPQEFLEVDILEYGLNGFFIHAMGSAHDKRNFVKGFIEKMGVPKEEIVLVGDMTHDIVTGNSAGIMTAAVLSGYHSKEKLEEKEPNFILNDIRDLKYIVEGWYV